MKKLITTAFMLLGFYLLSNASIDWTIVNDIAESKEVIASSNRGGGNPNNLTGNGDWEAKKPSVEGETNWFVLNLGESVNFSVVEIEWKRNHPTDFDIYVSDTPFPYNEVYIDGSDSEINYYQISEEFWNTNPEPIASGGSFDYPEDGFTETINFEPVKSQYILIYSKEYNGWGRDYGIGANRIRVGYIENQDEIIGISFNDFGTITEDQETTVDIKALKISGEIDEDPTEFDVTLSCSDETAVNITVQDSEKAIFKVEPVKFGSYTFTATATNKEDPNITFEVSTPVTILVNWEKHDNIAVNKAVSARLTENAAETYEHGFEKATDNNIGTYYTYDGSHTEEWLVLDLKYEAIIEAIGALYSESDGGTFKFGYATELETIPTGDFHWTKDENQWKDQFIMTPTVERKKEGVSYYFPNEPFTARYILISDESNPTKNPHLAEMYIAGISKTEDRIPSKLNINLSQDHAFVGENITFSYNIIDQYGDYYNSDTNPDINVNNGATLDIENRNITFNNKGVTELTISQEGLEASAKIYVANEEDYCLNDVEVTYDVETPNTDASNLTDGGQGRSNKGGTFELVGNDKEDPGARDHWILVDMKKEYNLDHIIILWEGACAGAYEVLVGGKDAMVEPSAISTYSTDDNFNQVFSVSGRGQNDWVDHIYGEGLDNTRYIKIHTTENATQWGIKIHELKAYGSPVEVEEDVTIPADDNSISTPDNQAVAIFSNHYNTTDAPAFEGFGSPAPTMTLVAVSTASKEEGTEEENEDTSSTEQSNGKLLVKAFAEGDAQSVLYFNGFTADNSGALVNLNKDVTGAKDLNLDIYSETTGTITVNGKWKYDDVTAEGDKPYEIEITDEKKGTWVKVAVPAENIGYGKNNVTTIDQITLSSTIPSFAIDNMYFEGSEALAVDTIGADNDLVDVYTLQGIRVMKASKSDAISTLPAGIYIINGSKVMIRK